MNNIEITDEELELYLESSRIKAIIDNNSVNDTVITAGIYNEFPDAEIKRLNEMKKKDSTNNKLKGIILNGEFIEVNSWWKMLEYILELAFFQEGMRKMKGVVFPLKWISTDCESMTKPQSIGETNYFMESAINSEIAIQRAKDIYGLIEDLYSISLVIDYSITDEVIDEKDRLGYNEYNF